MPKRPSGHFDFMEELRAADEGVMEYMTGLYVSLYVPNGNGGYCREAAGTLNFVVYNGTPLGFYVDCGRNGYVKEQHTLSAMFAVEEGDVFRPKFRFGKNILYGPAYRVDCVVAYDDERRLRPSRITRINNGARNVAMTENRERKR